MAANVSPLSTIPAVYWKEDTPGVTPKVAWGRASPIGDPERPRWNSGNTENRAAFLGKIVDYLDVEKSPRYAPDQVTYCNVYACDYCYLAGYYLPRIWWTDQALASIRNGSVPEVKMYATVSEVTANELLSWLRLQGRLFGWNEMQNLTDLQDCADAGGAGIVCAKAAGSAHGHITVVVPETPEHPVPRADGKVKYALQSQAGRHPKAYLELPAEWWKAGFASFGFFMIR